MIRVDNNLQCFDGVSSQGSYMIRKDPMIQIMDDTSS
jgi:hypothetical protein